MTVQKAHTLIQYLIPNQAVSTSLQKKHESKEAQRYFKSYTKEEFISHLKESREQAKRGEVITHEQLISHVREKYGLSL